uniref:Uncharacterized protein n=1 Tax=viral metagenome TaxID=1070528 RepID=A0A6M3LIK9_9ZZZZ
MLVKKLKSQCKHENIVITEKSYYRNIKDGYFAECERPDTDFGKYFIEGEQISVFCEDCGEIIE